MRAKLTVLLLALSAWVECGCGQVAQEPVARLRGQVTVSGQPLAFGEVLIEADNRPPITAMLNEAGEYDSAETPVGVVRLAVITPKRPAPVQAAQHRASEGGKKGLGKREGAVPDAVFRLSDRYRSPTKSGLSTVVNLDGSSIFNIEIP